MASSPEDTPASVVHARQAFAAGQTLADPDDTLGALLRGIVSTRLAAVILVSGTRGVDLAAWIIDGLDISSRLVMHHATPSLAADVKSGFSNDLRVTTHVQEFADFMQDVSRHRFAMVVLAPPDIDQNAVSQAAAAVDDGGVLVFFEGVGALYDPVSPDLDGFCLLARSDNYIALVKRHPGNRPRRRGGRRRTQS